jgi:hypothetical protein
MAMVALLNPRHLVFVDESACDRRTTYRNRGWAMRGDRAVRKAFFVRGQRCVAQLLHKLHSDCANRYSILPALSLNGILYVDIVEGSFTAELFQEFIRGLLPQMGNRGEANSIIVMDNCRIHKDPEVLQMILDRYGCILRLQF